MWGYVILLHAFICAIIGALICCTHGQLICAIFALVLAAITICGVMRWGWENLMDEILCGATLLSAFVLGAHLRGCIFLALFFAPVALLVGFIIGAACEPWSQHEFILVAICSVVALVLGFPLGKGKW